MKKTMEDTENLKKCNLREKKHKNIRNSIIYDS